MQAAMMAVQISTVVLGSIGLDARMMKAAEDGMGSLPDGQIRAVEQEVAMLSVVGKEGDLDNGGDGGAAKESMCQLRQ